MTIRPVQEGGAPGIEPRTRGLKGYQHGPFWSDSCAFALHIMPAATGLFRDRRSHFAPITLAVPVGRVERSGRRMLVPGHCSF